MSAVIHELIGNRLSCIAERGNITESQWVRGGGGREGGNRGVCTNGNGVTYVVFVRVHTYA